MRNTPNHNKEQSQVQQYTTAASEQGFPPAPALLK